MRYKFLLPYLKKPFINKEHCRLPFLNILSSSRVIMADLKNDGRNGIEVWIKSIKIDKICDGHLAKMNL